MISILLATYNGEKYIKESIDSIVNQTIKEWELLVGFNGTTDSSKNIVSEYKDNRIRIFDYGDDKGKSKTLNKLLKESRYEWCGIQDDDDIWLPDKLEKQIKYINDYDVIGTQINYLENEYLRKGPNLSLDDSNIKKLSYNGINQVANTSAIFNKSLALSINGWKDGLDGIEDFDFWLRLMRLDKKFINLQDFLVKHRLHKESNFNTKKYNLSIIL
jgi:glycosyltransferase involved in cell wall biosynthesis